jgi:hypothetical protein
MLPTWLAPCDFSVSQIEDNHHFDTIQVIEAESQVVQNMTSRMHLKMAEVLGTMNMRGRGLPQGWWWPLGPKLVFDKMAAPFPEIMDISGIVSS